MKQTTKFTCEIPRSLHTELKIRCALEGTKMGDVMRTLLEREYAASTEHTKRRGPGRPAKSVKAEGVHA